MNFPLKSLFYQPNEINFELPSPKWQLAWDLSTTTCVFLVTRLPESLKEAVFLWLCSCQNPHGPEHRIKRHHSGYFWWVPASHPQVKDWPQYQPSPALPLRPPSATPLLLSLLNVSVYPGKIFFPALPWRLLYSIGLKGFSVSDFRTHRLSCLAVRGLNPEQIAVFPILDNRKSKFHQHTVNCIL